MRSWTRCKINLAQESFVIVASGKMQGIAWPVYPIFVSVLNKSVHNTKCHCIF